jgi:hypothetical protein
MTSRSRERAPPSKIKKQRASCATAHTEDALDAASYSSPRTPPPLRLPGRRSPIWRGRKRRRRRRHHPPFTDLSLYPIDSLVLHRRCLPGLPRFRSAEWRISSRTAIVRAGDGGRGGGEHRWLPERTARIGIASRDGYGQGGAAGIQVRRSVHESL